MNIIAYFTATERLQIKHVLLPKYFLEKYLSSYRLQETQHSTSTFLPFANIARLLNNIWN